MIKERNLQGMQIGAVGTGAMAEALMRGLLAQNLLQPSQIVGYDVRADRLAELRAAIGIMTVDAIEELLTAADVVILSVKPQHMPDVLRAIAPHASPRTLFVSIAAGVSLLQLETALGTGVPVVRVMPNTPALVGKGISAVSHGRHATEQHVALVHKLFSAVGKTISLSEELLDAVTGLSGSGPAYLCLIVEAMADGGVRAGLPRDVSLRLAIETMRGTGELLAQALDAGRHPVSIREQVTSPAGTTAAGLHVLESVAVRGAFARAVCEAADRARVLGKE